MKSLEEYILEDYCFDIFDNYILSECNIELWKNTPILLYGNIYESLGIFNGAKEIAKYIISQLNNNTESTNILLSDIPKYNGDLFTELIMINIEYDKKYLNKESGEYIQTYMSKNENANDYNVMRWNNVDKKFVFIEINIKCDYNNINKIYPILLHELNHAYNDYIHIKKSGFDYSLIQRNLKSKYYIISNKNETESNIEKACKDILYLLNKNEQEAYISQMNGELKDKYNNIKDAIKDLSKSSVYQNYKTLYVNYHIIIDSKEYLDKFCNLYRNIYDKPNLSNKKIIDIIENKYNKFWKKFINHIYHIATDHVIYEKYATRDSRERIPLLDMSLLEQKGDDIDDQWLNDEKPVMTKDGRQAIITKIDYDKVPNIIKGKVKWNDKLLDYEWNDEGLCIKALDRLGNPKKADESDKLVKAQ